MTKNADHRGAMRAAVIAVLATSCAVLMACPPDAELEPLSAVWQTGEYDLAALKLSEYRSCPYGKNARVDYMLATSLCRIDVARIGVRYFERMLASYYLSAEDLPLVVQERDRCGLYYEKPSAVTFYGRHSTTVARDGRFAWARPASPIGGQAAMRTRDFTSAEMRSRLFERAAAGDAAEAAAARLGSDAELVSTDHLLVTAVNPRLQAKLRQIGRSLEELVKYVQLHFQIPEQDLLVTVYLVADQEELGSLAEKVHGLSLPPGSIGYYAVDDLSLVAVVQDSDIAALQHELLHLMVRTDFGDIPPWLDEGLGALFEVSRPSGTGRVALSNWREAILKDLWVKRPQLGELLRMDRAAFDSDGDPVQQAVNYATARYLMMYLQETDLLQSVYREIRANDAHDIEVGSGTDAVRDMERVTGKTIDMLDSAFTTWFRSLAPSLDTETVRALQTRLNALGFRAGTVDGVYGPRTTHALRRFQSSVGLKPADEPDRATIDALDGAMMDSP
jgi:hypothetical protein